MLDKIGIGVDIVDVKRFKEKQFKDNENFYKKIFRASEIEYCLNRKTSSQSFAAMFAIKESVIKSIDQQINFLDIKIEHINSKPFVTLLNNPSYSFLVSVSHENFLAVAVVISEKC